MWGNQVVYQIRRGEDGLPRVVRLQAQKCPGTEALGLFLSSTPGATPEEVYVVSTSYYTTSDPTQCNSPKNIPRQPRPLRPLPR
jgi:hypothetical protein